MSAGTGCSCRRGGTRDGGGRRRGCGGRYRDGGLAARNWMLTRQRTHHHRCCVSSSRAAKCVVYRYEFGLLRPARAPESSSRSGIFPVDRPTMRGAHREIRKLCEERVLSASRQVRPISREFVSRRCDDARSSRKAEARKCLPESRALEPGPRARAGRLTPSQRLGNPQAELPGLAASLAQRRQRPPGSLVIRPDPRQTSRTLD
jgi:hypothetical protein